jgi:hypothetical protein
MRNMKCYPIDIDTDVDKDGTVMINPEKKPIAVGLESTEEKLLFNNTTRNQLITTLAVLAFILIAFIIIYLGILFFYRSEPIRLKDIVSITEQVSEVQEKAAAAGAGQPDWKGHFTEVKDLLQKIKELATTGNKKGALAEFQALKNLLAAKP